MKKPLFLILSLLTIATLAIQGQKGAKIYIFESGNISFFSEAPLENIEAKTDYFAAALSPENRKFAYSVQISSFKFDKSRMEEHFNENYMESDKFPKATFTGEIVEAVDLFQDGDYEVTAQGKLNIHGVEQPRSLPVSIKVKNGKISFSSHFQVKLVDHNIEVPTIVVAKIAEVIEVKVSGVLKPKE